MIMKTAPVTMSLSTFCLSFFVCLFLFVRFSTVVLILFFVFERESTVLVAAWKKSENSVKFQWQKLMPAKKGGEEKNEKSVRTKGEHYVMYLIT